MHLDGLDQVVSNEQPRRQVPSCTPRARAFVYRLVVVFFNSYWYFFFVAVYVAVFVVAVLAIFVPLRFCVSCFVPSISWAQCKRDGDVREAVVAALRVGDSDLCGRLLAVRERQPALDCTGLESVASADRAAALASRLPTLRC